MIQIYIKRKTTLLKIGVEILFLLIWFIDPYFFRGYVNKILFSIKYVIASIEELIRNEGFDILFLINTLLRKRFRNNLKFLLNIFYCLFSIIRTRKLCKTHSRWLKF